MQYLYRTPEISVRSFTARRGRFRGQVRFVAFAGSERGYGRSPKKAQLRVTAKLLEQQARRTRYVAAL